MNKLVLVLIAMISISAKADPFAAVFINAKNTEAKLLLTENLMDGELSKLFDQMKVTERGTPTRKTKEFALKNGRFGFSCNKGLSGSNPPSTVCTFFIKQGENSSDINTFISKIGNEQVASLGVSPVISSELNGIFPADSANSVSYVLSYPNKVVFEVKGSTFGNLTIGFSAR